MRILLTIAELLETKQSCAMGRIIESETLQSELVIDFMLLELTSRHTYSGSIDRNRTSCKAWLVSITREGATLCVEA